MTPEANLCVVLEQTVHGVKKYDGSASATAWVTDLLQRNSLVELNFSVCFLIIHHMSENKKNC